MTKVNGIMIVVCSVLALTLSQVAQGVVTNPQAFTTIGEGFEGYAPVDPWTPTEAGQGWEVGYLWPGEVQAGAFDLVWEGDIKDSVVTPGTQVHSVSTSHASGEGGLVSTWYKSLPDSGSDVTYTSWDIAPTNQTLGDQFLMHVSRLNDNSMPVVLSNWAQSQAGNASWTVGIVSALVTPTYGGLDVPHSNTAYLQTMTGEGTWAEEAITGIDMTVVGWADELQQTPGTNWNKWFTVEVQEDNLLSKTRARIYETGTSPGAEDGWTSWLDHHATLHGLDYATDGKVVVRSQGFMEYDNFRMAGTAPTGPIPGDINGDGQVDGLDLNLLGADWQSTTPVTTAADINNDGIVDGLDLNILGGNWQAGVPAPGAAIPEPASLALLGIGAIAMLRRRSA